MTPQRRLEAPHRRLESSPRGSSSALAVVGYRAAAAVLAHVPPAAVAGGHRAADRRRATSLGRRSGVRPTPTSGTCSGSRPIDPRVRRLALRAYREYARYMVELMRLPSRPRGGARGPASRRDGVERSWPPGGRRAAADHRSPGHVGNNEAVAAAPRRPRLPGQRHCRRLGVPRALRAPPPAAGVVGRADHPVAQPARALQRAAAEARSWRSWSTGATGPTGSPSGCSVPGRRCPAGPATLAGKTGATIAPRRDPPDAGRAGSGSRPDEPFQRRVLVAAPTSSAPPRRSPTRSKATIRAAPDQWYSFKPIWPSIPAEAGELDARAAAMLADGRRRSGPGGAGSRARTGPAGPPMRAPGRLVPCFAGVVLVLPRAARPPARGARSSAAADAHGRALVPGRAGTRGPQARANLRPRRARALAAHGPGSEPVARRAATDPDALERLVRADLPARRPLLPRGRPGGSARPSSAALARIDVETPDGSRGARGRRPVIARRACTSGRSSCRPSTVSSTCVGHPVTAPDGARRRPGAPRSGSCRSRGRPGIHIVPDPDARRALVAALPTGPSPVGIVADRDITGGGVLVPFFGHPAPVPTAPALVALETGVPIYVGGARRLPGGATRAADPRPARRREGPGASGSTALTAADRGRLRVDPRGRAGAVVGGVPPDLARPRGSPQEDPAHAPDKGARMTETRRPARPRRPPRPHASPPTAPRRSPRSSTFAREQTSST